MNSKKLSRTNFEMKNSVPVKKNIIHHILASKFRLYPAATSIIVLLFLGGASFAQIPATINGAGTWSASSGSGSITFAAGSCYSVTVTAWGGGGGGGGAANDGASGGGAGGGLAQGVVSISGGSICYYSIGTGGTAGTTAGNNGGNGSPTWFNGTSGTNNNTTGSFINAGGGAGGNGATTNAGAAAQTTVGTGTFGASGVTVAVSYSGGSGGGGFVNGSGDGGGGGGGGAAGTGGNGGNGATTTTGQGGACANSGGGGGGGGGGAAGAGANGNPGNTNGGGGTGGAANGGGAGGTANGAAAGFLGTATAGGAGVAFGGGGGAGNGCCGCSGGPGGNGAPGGGSIGGGGGGGTGDGGGGNGGNGGAHGGGGAGADGSSSAAGGTGGDGYITITVATIPIPTATAGPALAAICAGATSAIMGGSVSAGATALWTGGTGTWTNATDPANATYTAGAAESGTITLTLTATNACGTNTTTKTITINPAPAAPTVTSPVTYCQNATATPLTATGVSLLWYTVATGGVGSATAPTPSTAATGSTTYYVSQTQTGCESPRAPITVTVNALPTAGASNTGPYCGTAGTITLNGSGGTSYTWSGPNGYTGTGASPAPFSAATYGAGLYSVTVSNASNCTAVTTTNVVINNTAAPTATSPVVYCQNETATPLTATGTSLLWYTVPTGGVGSSTAPTPSTTATGSTTYYVTQTQAGCESARTPITVTVNPAPTAGASNTGPYCGTGGTITINATGGTSYTWSGPNGYSGTGASPAPFSTATYGAGTYSVTVTDASTCTATTTTLVVINNTPAPTVTSPIAYCQNAAATPLTATGIGLLWYTVATGGVGSATAPTPSTAATGSTTYYVSQTQNGCESSRASITVTVNPTPTAMASNTGPYCTSGTISLSASGGTSYSWSGPNGYTGTGASPVPFSAATYGAGTYAVTVTDANTCTATAGTNVVVASTITIPVSQSVCSGQSIIFNGQNLSTAGIYNDTLTSVSGCDSIIILTLTVIPTSSSSINQTICGGTNFVFNGQSLTASGTYYDTLTNAAGCDSIIILTLNVPPKPVAEFSIQPVGDSVELGTNITVTNTSANADSVQWLLNNQVTSLPPGNTLPISDTGLYCISLIAANTAGCKDTSAQQCINIYSTGPQNYYMPNAFTPNGDGINDFISVYGNKVQIIYLSIQIYDRWGEKIFESLDADFKWDGTYKGTPEPAGIYVYVLNITFRSGPSIHNRGGITLIR